MTDKFPYKTEKPWGYELLLAHTPDYASKLIFVKAGHRLSLQYHKKKDESMYIHDGEVLFEIEDSNGKLTQMVAMPGFCIRIQPLTKHRVKAIKDSFIFEVSTPELQDVERVDDDYGRAK